LEPLDGALSKNGKIAKGKAQSAPAGKEAQRNGFSGSINHIR
jgi:hypothetical protein